MKFWQVLMEMDMNMGLKYRKPGWVLGTYLNNENGTLWLHTADTMAYTSFNPLAHELFKDEWERVTDTSATSTPKSLTVEEHLKRVEDWLRAIDNKIKDLDVRTLNSKWSQNHAISKIEERLDRLEFFTSSCGLILR